MLHENEPIKNDGFEKVLREVPDPKTIAQLLEKHFVPQHPHLTFTEISNGVNQSLIESISIFATSKEPDGTYERIFSNFPLENQAEAVGFLLSSQHSISVKDDMFANPAKDEIVTLFNEVETADRLLFELKDEDDNGLNQELDKKFQEMEKLFHSQLHISYAAYEGEYAWLPHFYGFGRRMNSDEEHETVYEIASHLFSYRAKELKDRNPSKNQIIGLASLSLKDANIIVGQTWGNLKTNEVKKELDPQLQERYQRIVHILKSAFDDPKISDEVYITDDETKKIVEKELSFETIHYFHPEAFQARPVDWSHTISYFDDPTIGKYRKLTYSPLVDFATEIANFAKTGTMDRERLEYIYTYSLNEYIKRASDDLEITQTEIGRLLHSITGPTIDNYQDPSNNAEENEFVSIRNSNKQAVIEIARYLVEKMIADNLKKITSENSDPDSVSHWYWFEWINSVFHESFHSAFAITHHIQKRLEN